MSDYRSLRDKVVIVTGGDSGIGKASCFRFAEAGAHVVINFHKEKDDAEEMLKEFQKKGYNSDSIVVQADVGNEQDVRNLFDETMKKYGRLDVLVNNAGIQEDKLLVDMSIDDWNAVIGTNLTGSFLCAREAAKIFIGNNAKSVLDENGKARARAKIIFMSSVHDRIAWPGHSNYAASKGGVSMLMKSIAQELAPYKIRVNSISPGAIKTPINEKEWGSDKGKKDMLEKIPYQRIGEPEDIANVVLWLASDESDYITGETIYVDGGMTLYPLFNG